MTCTPFSAENWSTVRLAFLFEPRTETGQSGLDVLSVYRDFGVIPKSSRDDNFNRTPADLSRYQVVHPGDLVVNRMKAWQGSLGVSAHQGLVSPDYEVLRPTKPKLDPRFVHHLLRSRKLIGEYVVRSTGIRPSQWRLYWAQMRMIVVSIPALSAQRAIAGFVDLETARIDTLIEEQLRLIELLRERRAAAIESALAAASTAATGRRLKHVVVEVQQGWSPQCYPWAADGVTTWAVLKAGAANGGVFRHGENKELPDSEVPRPETTVRRGQLVVSRANTRELAGSAAVVDDDYPRLMLSDKLYGFTLDADLAVPSYVASVLGTRRWRGLIELEASGSSPSMQNISQSDILNLPMDLPDVAEQHRIVAVIDERTSKIDMLIAETERFIELSRERRSALITSAVTGQLNVRSEVT